MAESASERQRRSRAHRAGDHSMCVPGRCAAVTPDVTEHVTASERDTEPERPQLGESGSRLWREMAEDGSLPPMAMVLLLEACRIADRLDQLDRQLQGEAWLEFQQDEGSGSVVVVMDKALAEARQQAATFKQLMAEMRQVTTGHGNKKKSAPAAPADSSPEGGVGVADLTARINERRAASD